METKAYWAVVHRRACLETRAWRRDHPEATIGGIILAVIGIVAIWSLAPEATWPEIVLRSVGTTVILLAPPWVYWSRLLDVPRLIPGPHFESSTVNASRFFAEPESNYETSTWSASLDASECYRDIHFRNGARAVIWLTRYAESWKGKHNQAKKLKAAEHAKWEAEVLEQGYDFEGDENSEQGRRIVKRPAGAQD